jgi:ribonuclease E
MSIRLDPRRLAALKLLAAEAGVRPGELVTNWVEERLDAARAGKSVAAAAAPAALAELSRRVDELAKRLDALAGPGPVREPAATTPEPSAVEAVEAVEAVGAVEAPEAPAAQEAPAKRGPGRPRKTPAPSPAPRATSEEAEAGTPRVPLHEEIAAVIAERGPLTAAEIAGAIGERGRYHAPRSARPLDAATVNSRVSNPAYRARFTRDGGRIGLATG